MRVERAGAPGRPIPFPDRPCSYATWGIGAGYQSGKVFTTMSTDGDRAGPAAKTLRASGIPPAIGVLLALVLLVWASAFGLQSARAAGEPGTRAVEGPRVGEDWIVAVRSGRQAERIARLHGASESREFTGLYSVPAASATEFIAALRLGGLLRYAEPDVDPSDRAYPGGTPADGQWWLNEIVNTRETTPPAVTRRSPQLAIVTPGIYRNHPALRGVRVDGADSAGVALDQVGTGLAGIAAATGRDQGFLGVWPRMNLRHAPSGDGNCLEASEAVRKAARRGSEVIVMGYAFPPGTCRTHLAATQYAIYKGSVLVAASGDGGSTELSRPAGDPHVLSVGSIDRNLSVSPFSNTGAKLDLVAPGDSVLAPSLEESGTVTPGFGYANRSGTRYSATMVGAAAAWLIQARGQLQPSQVRAVLVAGARDLGTAGRDDQFGSGLLDIEGALAAPGPTADRYEPNDDTGWVNGRLLRDGKKRIGARPIWPAGGKKLGSFQATLSDDDPADVYRVKIPGRSRVEIGVAQAEGDVLVEVRTGDSRTIASTTGTLDVSDLEPPRTEGLAVRNGSGGFRLIYLVVKPSPRSTSDGARYRVKVGRTLSR